MTQSTDGMGFSDDISRMASNEIEAFFGSQRQLKPRSSMDDVAWAESFALCGSAQQLIHTSTKEENSKETINSMHVDHKRNVRRTMTGVSKAPTTSSTPSNRQKSCCLQSSTTITAMWQSRGREIISDRIEGLISQEKSAAYSIKDYLRDFETNVSEPVDASCRTKMIDWLYICVTTLRLRRSVVPIAFSYADRLLSSKENQEYIKTILQDRNRYQLLVITCLYIAVKLSEPEVLSPTILSKLSQGRYSEQDIEKEELRILEALNWRLTGPTTSEFVQHFLAFDFLPNGRSDVETAARLTIKAISRTQAELSVADQSLVSVPYSVLALASIRNAMEDVAYYTPQEWVGSLSRLSAVSETDPFAPEVDEAMCSLRKIERDSALGTALSLLSSDLVCHSPKRHRVARPVLSPTSVSRVVSVKSFQ